MASAGALGARALVAGSGEGLEDERAWHTATLRRSDGSVVLIGVRSVRDYVVNDERREVPWLGSASPFNVTVENVTLAAFTEREARFERNLAGDVTLDEQTQADLGRLGYAE